MSATLDSMQCARAQTGLAVLRNSGSFLLLTDAAVTANCRSI